MPRNDKEREPSYHKRSKSSGSVQPGGTDNALWASREKEMARRKDPGWLQIIFDQTWEDNKKRPPKDAGRIGGLTPERAQAIAEILIEQARRSDEINNPRHALRNGESGHGGETAKTISEIPVIVGDLATMSASRPPNIEQSQSGVAA